MLITNATLITWDIPNQVLSGHALYVQGDRIADMGPQAELVQRYPQAERIDAAGQLVMPGNICAHTHFYGAFARGLGIPGPAPRDFPQILEKLWWPLDQALTEEGVRASAQVMLLDAVRNGTTTLIDHHASPNALEGSLDQIAGAVEEAGLRAVLCYEVTDRYGPESAEASILENLRFMKTWHVEGARPAHPLIRAAFGLHASLTLSENTLERCRELAPNGAAFHIHVAEHEADEYDSLQRSGMRVVDRLHRHGILGPSTIVAHAVHVDAREIQLLADSGTWVTHQPRSNMNNAVGVAEVESMLRAGIPVCLGTDGFSHTMWTEWKTAYLLHKAWHRDPRRMNGMDIVAMGVYNNAALGGRFFSEAPLGVLRPGAFADLIFVEYRPFTPMTPDNLPWHIIFGFHESMVSATMVAGKMLMYNRRLLTLDEAEILAQASRLAPQIWERYRQYVPD